MSLIDNRAFSFYAYKISDILKISGAFSSLMIISRKYFFIFFQFSLKTVFWDFLCSD